MLRALIRLLLGWVFLRAGVDVLRTPGPRVATSAWLLDPLRARVPFLPEHVLLVQANAALQVGAAGLLALGR